MSHVFHDNLPGFNPQNVLHDGCPECEHRASDPFRQGIPSLDDGSRATLWLRMMVVEYGRGMPEDWADISGKASDCDRAIMGAMYNIAVFMERAGITVDEIAVRLADKSLNEGMRA